MTKIIWGLEPYKKRISACMVLYILFPLIWYKTVLHSVKQCFELLTPHQGSRVCVRTESVLAWCSLPHSHFAMHHEYFQKKKTIVWPLTPPQESRVCWRREHVLACRYIRNSLNFDMQHDHVLKKLNFVLLTPPPGPVERGRVYEHGQIFATTLMRVSFCLRWYATWPYSEKNEFWPFSNQFSPLRGTDPGLRTEMPFDMFHIYNTSFCMHNFSKIILATDWVIAKFDYLIFGPA